MGSPTQPYEIPQEIINIIIDDDSHDEEAYKTFALVSKSFLYQSRRHFFREIRFWGDDTTCRGLPSRFWEILDANPDIASYVREVYIEDLTSDFVEDQWNRPSWVREEETFQKILLVLAKGQISNLTLETDLDWRSFPIALQHALTQILTAPSLVNLDIASLTSIPVSCYTHFPRLAHLRISGVTLAESEDHPQMEVATVTLSSLDVARLRGRSAQILSNILAAREGRPQVVLEKIRVANCDAGFTREIILAAQKSLRNLTLSAGSNTPLVNITLGDLESLCYLQLQVFPQQDHHWQLGTLSILETGGPNKELRTIHIKLYHGSFLNWVDYLLHESTISFWRGLSTTLERFSGLMELVVELVVFHGEDSALGEEERAGLQRSVCSGLGDDKENTGSVKRKLRVEISVL